MPWSMFGGERARVSSSDCAKSLFTEFVNPATSLTLPVFKEVGTEGAAYRERSKIFRTAAVILTLASQMQNRHELVTVLHDFEKLVFPPTYEEGAVLLEAVKTAMQQLNAVAATQSHQLSWSRQWFAELSIDATNPVDLTCSPYGG